MLECYLDSFNASVNQQNFTCPRCNKVETRDPKEEAKTNYDMIDEINKTSATNFCITCDAHPQQSTDYYYALTNSFICSKCVLDKKLNGICTPVTIHDI